jgi:hypothetical protein
MSTLAAAGSASQVTVMDKEPSETATDETPEPAAKKPAPKLPKEIGGVEGPEPTRYGDWQHKGRVTDF